MEHPAQLPSTAPQLLLNCSSTTTSRKAEKCTNGVPEFSPRISAVVSIRRGIFQGFHLFMTATTPIGQRNYEQSQLTQRGNSTFKKSKMHNALASRATRRENATGDYPLRCVQVLACTDLFVSNEQPPGRRVPTSCMGNLDEEALDLQMLIIPQVRGSKFFEREQTLDTEDTDNCLITFPAMPFASHYTIPCQKIVDHHGVMSRDRHQVFSEIAAAIRI